MHGRLRARPGALEPRRRPGRLQRQAPGPRHGPIRADHGGRHPPRPGDGGRPREPGHQWARGVHAGQRVHPGRVARSAASGWRRASRPTASPGRAGSAARSRAGSSTANRSWTSGRWTSGGSARHTARSATRWPGRSRTTRPTTTSTTRTRSASPAVPCARRPRTSCCASSVRPSARSRAGSVRTGSRVERGSRRRGASAARLGGQALVAGDRGRGARDAHVRRSVRRELVREARGVRPRLDGVARLDVRQRHRSGGRIGRLHPAARSARRDPGGPHRHATGPRSIPPGHRDGLREPRCGVAAAAHAGGWIGRAPRRDRSAWCASGSGGRELATSSARSPDTTSRTRRSRS